MAAKLCFLGRWMRSRRPRVATSPPRGGRSSGRSVWMDSKGEDVARTQRWWRRVFSCGFAHRSPRNDKLCNLFLGRICIQPSPQAPSYHPWSHSTDAQVDAGPSSRLRLRTFAMEVLPEPKPGNCIPFHPSLLKKTGPAIASDQCREAEAPPSKAGYESRGRKG